MIFVDDIVLCSKTRQEAEERPEFWRKVLEERCLKINIKKTEYLYAGGGNSQGKITEL